MDNFERGFISKEQILEYVTEKEIFSLIFGYEPVEFVFVTSPFREDENPGCWFSYDPVSGKLRFSDFGNPNVIDGISMQNMDCFDAVQVYFGLKNFYQTLNFIKEKLIDGRNISHNILEIKAKKKVKKEVDIFIDIKEYEAKDGRYWSKFGITRDQLLTDKVFSFSKYAVRNSKYGDIIKRVEDPSYAFTGFDNGRKKLYRPFQDKGSKKFLTNCGADDIGELWQLPAHGQHLVIKKSYKDCRVLRNEGLASIWFQNEGTIPNLDKLANICRRFDKVTVFYDNDVTGIEASKKVSDMINQLIPDKSTYLYLPERLLTERRISDPAELYSKMGRKHLVNFLEENIKI